MRKDESKGKAKDEKCPGGKKTNGRGKKKNCP